MIRDDWRNSHYSIVVLVRTYIGGYRITSGYYEEIWFDKSVWNVETLPKWNGVPAYRLTRKEIQETERLDCIMPYLQDLVQHENESRIEWVVSPLHIRFGKEEES